MVAKRQKILYATLFFLFFFLITSSLRQIAAAQSSSNRLPKDVAKITLPELIDLGAGKCIPCKKMASILQKLSDEYKGRVIIKIIEIYEERELTRANRIGIPL